MFGVKRFHLYLYGRSFTLATDHKPLLSLFGAKKPVLSQASGRIQRWALTLSMYNYTLIHKKSAQHGNADALSRLPLPESISSTPIPAETVLLLEQMNEMPVTAEHIKTWTRRDPILSRVLQFTQHGWPARLQAAEEFLRPYWSKRMELSSQSGCLLWGGRVIVPAVGRPKVLQELHEAHPGSTRIKGLLEPWSGGQGWTKILRREFNAVWSARVISALLHCHHSNPGNGLLDPGQDYTLILLVHSWDVCFSS